MESFGGLIIFLMIFILGFAAGESYSNVTKKENKKVYELKPTENTTYEMHLTRKITELKIKLKETELKTSYYIQVIKEIEQELKTQQFNSITNLINRINTIISKDRTQINKEKELINSATNEND